MSTLCGGVFRLLTQHVFYVAHIVDVGNVDKVRWIDVYVQLLSTSTNKVGLPYAILF